MKKLTVKVIAASLIALSAFSVSALEKPVSSSLDKRVLYTEHKEGQVYPINAVNGVKWIDLTLFMFGIKNSFVQTAGNRFF